MRRIAAALAALAADMLCLAVDQPNLVPGTGTRSATPLAWTHAQFVRLAWSIDAGRPVERPSIVACRYAGDCTP